MLRSGPPWSSAELTLLMLIAAYSLCISQAYLVLVPDTALTGEVIFNASVYKLGSDRHYKINTYRTANFVHHILHVESKTGRVSLRKRLRCDGVMYPNLFTFYIESTSERIRDIDYYSLPVRILITGEDCSKKGLELFDEDVEFPEPIDDIDDEEDPFIRDKRDLSMYGLESLDWRLWEDSELPFVSHFSKFHDVSHLPGHRHKRSQSSAVPFDMTIDVKLSEARKWISETYASFAIPTADRWQEICLKTSQYVNSLTAFLPQSIQKNCKVQFLDVNDDRFAIEASQGDLVASRDVCIPEPLWKVTVLFTFNCDRKDLVDSDHRLKIVYHHQEFNDTDIARRVRRELRNQSPFFEQALYVASVAEEQPPGVLVTTVRARDPENSPVSYSMSSLLDSRSAGMFGVDAGTGAVSTRARLDRELLDVHYFRVLAVDDSFPPRSATTTLQINVLDCNDHAPVFELQQYEASVREGASPGTTVITLKATDQDVGKNAEVEYSIESVLEDNGSAAVEDIEASEQSTLEENDQSAGAQFRIDGRTGALVTRATLDREKVARYVLLVRATDQASPITERMSSSATVFVNILDDNDNYPQFSEKTYTVSVDEDINLADNPVIARIKAADADAGANAAVRYAIIGGNTQMQFSIDTLSGDVSLVKPLDYELVRNYRLVIRAQDGGSPSRSNTTQLLVNVRDVNDNAPRFYTSLFQEAVSESVAVGYSIVRVQAYDADEGVNAELTYTLGGKEVDRFPLSIDSRTGWIYTARQLDREEQAKYQFQVIATDGGTPPRSASASVVVTIQDVNDNDPAFSPPQYEAALAEDEPPGTPVVTVTATDADEDNRLHYEITGGNTRGRFAVTSQNGRGLITVAQPLDFKQERRYVLTVTATDSGGRADTALVHINITDANNYAPVFENAPYTASVFEDAPMGTTVLVVSASDNDVGINAQITYSLGSEVTNEAMGASEEHEFIINPQTGAITTNKLLDREIISGYLLTVTAKDGGVPSLSDTTDVEISVVDVNDNAPQFKQQLYSANVPEDALIGTSVIQISATDADTGLNGRVRYELSAADREDGSFLVDAASGVIRTNKALDRESLASYDLRAIAKDGGTPAMSSTVVVHIRLDDINDSPPVFESDRLTLYVAENSPIGTTVGEIHARDPDEGVNAIIHYSIIGGDDSNSFSLVTRQGSDRAELVSMVDLDYESPRKQYSLVIRSASPPLWSDVHVDIMVTDVNDNAPTLKDFQIIFNNYKDCFPVGAFGKVPAYDADVTDKLIYRILSGNNANLVLINSTSGAMTLSPQLNTNVPKLATMEISVSDGVNEVKAVMQLSVRLITEQMLYNSITVRLNEMTAEAFLSPLLTFFIDGLAAIIPCPKENIYVFSIQDDTDVSGSVLNVSFSARRPAGEVDALGDSEDYYQPTHLRERVYLNRATLAKLATVQVLPFDDNVCVHEPCLNYEECLTVLKFGNASGFINSDTVLFRPIYPVTTFACNCPEGFTGSRQHYMCDTEVNLCYSSPCTNHGTCVRREGGYSCVCHNNYTGINCETLVENAACERGPPSGTAVCRAGSRCASRRAGPACLACSAEPEHSTPLCELRARSFQRASFLTFPSLRQRHRFHIKLKFATQNQNGLLLYNGRYNERHDFISLEVVSAGAGHEGTRGIRFTFSLGGGVSQLTVAGDVSDGNWHTVQLEYLNRTATLILDDCDKAVSLSGAHELGVKWACANVTQKELPARCKIPTETCHRFLDLTGPLQIGGLPSLPSSFQVKTKDFVGCIGDLYIDHKFIDLNSYVADNGTVAGCPEKRLHCASSPCYNSAVCTELWDTFRCECEEGFTGKDCSESTSQPWRFNGDGILSFNPLLRPIQLPWLNALSIRTRQQDAFLMSVQVGQNSSAVISLKSGLLHYTYNSESMFLAGVALADGAWHRVEVTWLGADVSVRLDYGARATLLPMLADKIQGLYVGKILIGGPDSAAGLIAAEYGYFEGCIQDVRVGTSQSLLNRPTVRENVRDGCQSRADCLLSACPQHGTCVARWDTTDCLCESGRVGTECLAACTMRPCGNHGRCVDDFTTHKGYTCQCLNETNYSGEHCDVEISAPCPSGWWGEKGCGPCSCPTHQGYHPDCNKTTGECHCKENHYSPSGSAACLPCECYAVGSFSGACDPVSGQCACRPGVVGRSCHACPNPYAEVTPQGCQVVYDGCPKSFSHGVWWPRTGFGHVALSECPPGTNGRASRACDESKDIPWQEPDMFNCTSAAFYQLRKQLAQLETGELQVNTFVGVKLSQDLMRACLAVPELFGADVLIGQGLLLVLIQHELQQAGLNLTHSQDKDYIRNLVKSANTVLNKRYEKQWERIRILTGHGVEHLVTRFDGYISVLAESQHDTYTNPFEIVTDNLVLGVDIVTAESIYGFEPTQLARKQKEPFTTERVILPDTSSFLHEPLVRAGKGYFAANNKRQPAPTISFPKYNNYMENKSKFDKHSRVLVPLDILGIKSSNTHDESYEWSSYESRAVFSYVLYSGRAGAAALMPLAVDESVSQRWGVELQLGSSLLQLCLHVPDYVWLRDSYAHDDQPHDAEDLQDYDDGISYSNKGETHTNKIHNPNNLAGSTQTKHAQQREHHNQMSEHDDHGPIIIQPTYKKSDESLAKVSPGSENEASAVDDKGFEGQDGPQALAYSSGDSGTIKKKLVYKSLSGVRLKRPVRLQMWLDIDRETFSARSNPQCVHWSTDRGEGAWSRVGCHTEMDYDWRPYLDTPLLINCTCNHLSTFAVLVDVVDLEFIPSPSLLEDVASYSALCVSLPVLLCVLLALCLVRGGQATISNSIHKHVVFCVVVAELLYLVALKARIPLVHNEFGCKLMAMSLHYWWVCAFAWCACDAWHVRRMVREVRDVNHGPMAAHLAAAYGAPAVAVALAAGVRAHQYGNALFCWVSCHEGVVWWVVAPVAALCVVAVVSLAVATHAAFTVREHICAFGNLRVLVGVSVVCLPLLVCVWAAALLLASEGGGGARGGLAAALAGATLAHALAAALGYCVLNARVRDNLTRSVLRCMGKKVPLLDTSVVVSGSSANISAGANRSALAYHSGAAGAGSGANASGGGRTMRHVGISASSTTSRSTNKTSSSPYSRSDGQLRHTSTSTSNYNSTGDMPSYLRGFDSSLQTRQDEERRARSRRRRSLAADGPAAGVSAGADASDSDTEGSAARSLDLASSHSSDDDETVSHRRAASSTTDNTIARPERTGYLPNITEGAPLPSLGQDAALAGLSPRWAAHAPAPYNTHTEGGGDIRWSQETGSDNEMPGPMRPLASPSPRPLPNPDLTAHTGHPGHGPHYPLRNAKPALLDNIHDTYAATVQTSNRIPIDHNQYGSVDNDYEMKYGAMPESDPKQYDARYQMSPGGYRMHENPYGSKPYLSSRTSDYGYSPTFMGDAPFGSRDFRDSGIATMLKNDYQRKLDNHYTGAADYVDRMSETSEKHHPHEKYLFPYTAEEDHVSIRGMNQPTPVHSRTDTGESHMMHTDMPPGMVAPLSTLPRGDNSEKSTTEDDAETRV